MTQPLERKIVATKDGSQTLYIPELNEHYHSANGAIQESMHVFINAGLNQFDGLDDINILEIGFGTGLNALLTLKNAKLKTYYHTIEKYPLKSNEIDALKYTKTNEELEGLENVFNLIHASDWQKSVNILPDFTLFKENIALKNFNPETKFNLIYFDAFAPDIQPDLWGIDVFEKMFNCLKPAGILVTYCAKGQVRRNMQAVGFKVERLPGPPGKREMLRAIKY